MRTPFRRIRAEWKAIWAMDPVPPPTPAPAPAPRPVPRRLATFLALAVLGFQLLDHLPPNLRPAKGIVTGCLLGLAFLWVTIHLITYGIRDLEEGWRRWVRLLALGLTLASVLPMGQDFTRGWESAEHGFKTGLEAGLASGSHEHPTPPPAVPPQPASGPTWEGFFTLGLGGLLAVLFHRMARHREESERQRARAEALKDQALRAKLAPHFIFNTLNTLKAQIARDPAAAAQTTDRLAQLFRQVVQVADRPTIPLRQELAFVEAYLGIEQARLGERLTTVIDVPEELEDTPIPPLSLQVLAENAVKHGIGSREAGGTVRIEVRSLGPLGVQARVLDPGRGLGTEPGTGTALDTLRQRLAKPTDLKLQATSEGVEATLLWRHP